MFSFRGRPLKHSPLSIPVGSIQNVATNKSPRHGPRSILDA